MLKRQMEEEQLEQLELEQLEKLLSRREREFCEHYLAERNGTQAAQRAGYSPDNREAAAVTASRLLRKAKIAAYLRGRAREIYEQLVITPETVAADLSRVYRRAMQIEPVLAYNRETGEMEPTGAYTFDGKTAIRALELIGDSLGMFEKGMRVEGESKLTIELGQAEELAK